jgi:manganese/zinc/iron transport system substrate-binding protein
MTPTLDRIGSLPRRAARFGALLALLAFVAGSAWAQAPLRVVATTAMVADTVAQVGGPCVEVVALMGPGIDPHLYRASAGDVDRLGRAELIVYNGLRLEGQLGAVLDRLGQRIPTLALAERIGERAVGRDRGRDRGRRAAARGARRYAGQVRPAPVARRRAVVGRRDGGGRGDRRAPARLRRRRSWRAPRPTPPSSARCTTWAAASLATVPAEHRTLVTSHDAFRYFGRAYGLEVHGIEGISTESEASIADIRATTDLVVATGVPALFVESTISPRTIEAVRAAVRDRGQEVDVGGTLYGDAMGDAGTPEGTYVGMLRHNVVTIVTALGGEVAPWPMELDAWADGWDLR